MRRPPVSYKRNIIGAILWFLVLVSIFVSLSIGRTFQLFAPAGHIASEERNLIIFTILLGCLVVIPVLVLVFVVAWRYRETNTEAMYTPEWDNNRKAEAIWWLIPCFIILVLSIVTWQSTKQLDPYRSLASTVKPVTVEVVALEWKWLFIYPDQHIATINQLALPQNTPINLLITADAPMNSLWIPQLSGQIYAMDGMSTQLHIVGNTLGTYQGASANLSGDGFAGMTFSVPVMKKSNFTHWVQSAAHSSEALTPALYTTLSAPSSNVPIATYTLADANLYNEVVMKYMMPPTSHPTPTVQTQPMKGMTAS